MTTTRTETREERFERLLWEAWEHGHSIQAEEGRSSRENSTAITKVEEAALWARRDRERKAQRAGQPVRGSQLPERVEEG